MTDLSVSALGAGLGDRYRIERELGRGGMATVYLARDLKHDRLVALKVLHPELAASLGSERFVREIRLTANLQHPHILPVFDSGAASGFLWYAMPYVEGESLRARLAREGRLPWQEAVGLVQEVAGALEYAHRQGIVHRDVKPENVLLSQSHALVADFGIAKGPDRAAPTLTETGVAIGTAVYMSPEQASGQAVTPASDQYSLGCMMYEMLVGTPPFLAPTAQGILARRFSEQAPRVRARCSDVPPAVDAAVARAMARAPDERHPTTAAFAEALSTAGTTYRTGRRRIASLAIALVLGAVGAAVLLRGPGSGSTTAPARRTTIAVLPPRSLGQGADTAFADGLGDEITTRLASVEGLGVIGRTSAGRYRTSIAAPTDIARELGADYVLVTTVRWGRARGQPRLRVTSELVRAADGTSAWSNGYDAEPADVFDVQSRVASSIASAMGVRLGGSTQARLTMPTSGNPEALRHYLRGRDAMRQVYIGYKDLEHEAIRAFGEATRLDPTFAAAYAGLADALLGLDAWNASAQRVRAADSAADAALRLDPDLPEARTARARILLARGQSDSALVELERAHRARPGSAEILRALGVALRERAELDSSLRVLAQAVRLDPQSAEALTEACISAYGVSRDSAAGYCGRIVVLEPDLFRSYLAVAWGAYLEADERRLDSIIGAYAGRVGLRAAVAPFASIFACYGSVPTAYDTTLLTLPDDDIRRNQLFLARALVRRAHGDRPEAVREDLDSAAAGYEARLGGRDTLGANGADWLEAQLGLTRALQGRHPEAVAVTRRVLARHPAPGNWYVRTEIHATATVALAIAGEPDEALDELEAQLRQPWLISRARLMADPLWDPMRQNPRFKRLLQGGA